jgi:PPOX class probable F420-dependent enzyme
MPTFMVMKLQTLPSWSAELLDRARVARLGYLDGEDRPRVLPVTFAVAGGFVWSAIDDKPKRRAEPARVGYLRRRPEASLLVDEYDDDWARLAWVQMVGRVEVVPAATAPQAMEALAARYSQYAASAPPGPLLRFEVGRVLLWRASDGSSR